MEQTIAVTNKWQIHIPVKIRENLGWHTPGLVNITTKKQKIVLHPEKSSILNLAGKYSDKKPIKKIKLEKIRDYIDYSNL